MFGNRKRILKSNPDASAGSGAGKPCRGAFAGFVPMRRRQFLSRVPLLGAMAAAAGPAGSAWGVAAGRGGLRPMIADLTMDSFAPHRGTAFRLCPSEGPGFEVELVEVRSLGRSPMAGMRDPFSLVFRAAAGSHVPQRIYPIEHAALGRLELFLVPIGPDAAGMCYEAVFA